MQNPVIHLPTRRSELVRVVGRAAADRALDEGAETSDADEEALVTREAAAAAAVYSGRHIVPRRSGAARTARG